MIYISIGIEEKKGNNFLTIQTNTGIGNDSRQYIDIYIRVNNREEETDALALPFRFKTSRTPSLDAWLSVFCGFIYLCIK